MKRVLFGLLGVLAFVIFTPGQYHTEPTMAASPGSGAKRLLNCPDVDGSGSVRSSDITAVVSQFGNDATLPTYKFMYDLDANGVLRSADIVIVVQAYGPACPLGDRQVAQATLAIYNHPNAAAIMACDDATLATLGYLRGSTNVPGQGVHYFKASLWDGTFDVANPEGLVCDTYNGYYRLAAELYVINGDNIGWGSFNPNGGPTSGVDIDVSPFTCASPPCSWDGPEGWHAHAYLCTAHIGTPSAWVLPGYTNAQDCEDDHNSTPCSGAGCPGTWAWDDKVGWMGHLWNFRPNENLLPDGGTTNGRYADCRPPFKHNTCPM
jgi:hypothetical protein